MSAVAPAASLLIAITAVVFALYSNEIKRAAGDMESER